MTTTANVCDLCAAINKPHILETGDLPRSRTWQQSLVFLSDNANGKLLGHEQCAFWKLVWDGITSFHSNLDLSFNVSVRRDDLEHGTGPLVVTVQQLNRPDLQFYTPVGAGRSPWEAIGRGYSISPFGLSESCTRLMRGWLEECTASQGKHSQCTAPILPYLPSRVIDVELLHLHCAQPGEKAHYVALSHCWGGQSPIQTTMQNLDAHIAGLPPLPQTFADAVAVTKALGTRYLWIDSLCIVQNSPEDWHAEVTKMAEVYENAFFTISADAAASATDGFLRPPSRSFTPETPIPYTSMCGNSSTTTTTTSFLASGTILVRERGTQALMLPFHSPVPPPPTPTQPSTRPLPRLIPISKLSTRGWVFQERVLAPRTLHFSRSETAWECPSLCTCECSATSARNHLRTSLLKDFFTTAAGVSPPRSRQRPPPDERWRREIVQEYSRLDLTVPTDRLVALGGLAARMARLRGGGDEYLAGLWRGTLGRDLLWYCVHEREKDKDKAGGRI
ncbi:heterokaryon incompatibility protein-domain-containing protein, partial [Cercophora newfieldiana]